MRGARQLPVSAGIGTPQRFGKLRTNDLIGMHVPHSYLNATAGSDPGAQRRARADVTVGNKTMRVPMFDSGGRGGRGFQPTGKLSQAMGTGDFSGARMQHRPEAGPDYMTDPQGFHEEQQRLGNEAGMRGEMTRGLESGQAFTPGQPSAPQGLQIPYFEGIPAMQEGGVVGSATIPLTAYKQPGTLSPAAFDQGYLDPYTGNFVDPKTGIQYDRLTGRMVESSLPNTQPFWTGVLTREPMNLDPSAYEQEPPIPPSFQLVPETKGGTPGGTADWLISRRPPFGVDPNIDYLQMASHVVHLQEGGVVPDPDTVDDTDGRGGKRVDAAALKAYLKRQFANSDLIGYVPPDGARWGIKTGSAEEWASFGLAVAKQESDLNPKSYNASDPGGSAGLFQFGQGQTLFTKGADQFDPKNSADAFVRSVEHYVSGGNVANLGATFGSIARPNEAGQYIGYAQGVEPSTDAQADSIGQVAPTPVTPEATDPAAVTQGLLTEATAPTTPSTVPAVSAAAMAALKPTVNLQIGAIGTLPTIGARATSSQPTQVSQFLPSGTPVQGFQEGGTTGGTPVLVGEAGSEKAVLPSGKKITVGKGGPEIRALPPGTRVIPHMQHGGTVPTPEPEYVGITPTPTPTPAPAAQPTPTPVAQPTTEEEPVPSPEEWYKAQMGAKARPARQVGGLLDDATIERLYNLATGKPEPKAEQGPLSDANIDRLYDIATGKGPGAAGMVSPFTETMLGAIPLVGPAVSQLSTTEWGRELLKNYTRAQELTVGVGVPALLRGAIDLAPALTDPYSMFQHGVGMVQDAIRDALNGALGDFTAKPIDQVQAQHDELVAQRNRLAAELQGDMRKGKTDPLTSTLLGGQLAALDTKIDEANGIIRTGVPLAPPQQNLISQGLGAVQEYVRGPMGAQLEAGLPTSREFDQSVAGKILSGAGQMGATLPFAFAGPEVAIPTFAAQFAGQAYDEARARGADDRTAQNSALLSALAAPLQYLAMEVPATSLAKALEGSTPLQAIRDMGRAVVMGGTSMGSTQVYQNFVARITGADPDRPLEEGVLQQTLLGAGLDAAVTALGRAPGLIRYARGADVRGGVRERPGSPAAQDQTPQTVQMPRAGAGASAVPVRPLAEAATQVAQTAGATDSEVIAANQDPAAEAERGRAELAQTLLGAGAAAETPAAVVLGPGEVRALTPAEAQAEGTPLIKLGEFTLPAGRTEPAAPVRAPETPPEASTQPLTLEQWRANYLARLNPEARARFDRLPPEDQERYLQHAANVSRAYTLEPGEERAPLANIRGEAVPPPAPPPLPGQRLDPAIAREITNRAGQSMDLEQRIRHVDSADSLPPRIKRALTKEQLASTAQTIYDKSTGELWVIGDRFSSGRELAEALIQDTLPRVYGGLSDLRIENRPNDPRLGYYNILGDRPVINLAAVMRTADPFSAASKTALEEIVTHQGISKLFGSRESAAYVTAMKAIRSRFDAMKMSEELAISKGFESVEDMANQYGWADYKTNAAHNNALTEELIGAYAQRFGTLDELRANSPKWYQQALGVMSDAIRRRLGMNPSALDVQNLIADSFSALRYPKYQTPPSPYHPEIVGQAQQDMSDYQLAARTGGTQPPAPVGEQAEAAVGRGPAVLGNIGDVFVAAQRAQTRAELAEGQGMRQQPERLSMQGNRPFDERMALAQAVTAAYDKRGLDLVMDQARRVYQSEFGGDVYRAMETLRSMGATDMNIDVQTGLRSVINEEINRSITDYRTRGYANAARGAEMKRDEFNRDLAPRVTDLAQGLNAQKLLHETGDTAVGRLQAGLIKAQARRVGRSPGVSDALSQIKEIAQRTVTRLINDPAVSHAIETQQANIDRRLVENPGSLADRYLQALADSINDRMDRLGLADADRPALQELFGRFQNSVQQMIREQMIRGPDLLAGARKLTATQTIREALSNLPMFDRAWDATIAEGRARNPDSPFWNRLEQAQQQPFGQAATRAVIRESGENLRDLVYKHFNTQDRVGNDIADGLMRGLNLDEDQALRVQEAFDREYRRALNDTARKELQGVLDRIQNPSLREPKGELDRLVDLMAIGGLSKEEYYNALAPRFNLGAWDPVSVARMRDLGQELMRIRDEGGPEVYKNRIAEQLADEIARSGSQWDINTRRAMGLWMASLLTGPFTHGSYYMQTFAQGTLNLMLRSLFRPGNDAATIGATFKAMFDGLGRGFTTDLPFILRTGTHTQRELPGGEVAGTRAEGIPYRPALEATPLPGGMQNPLNWYRYVGRFLHGMETVFYRGFHAGLTRSLAARVADRMGLDSDEALRYAEQMTYGTENDRQEARDEALEQQKRFGFDDNMLGVVQQEILDQKRYARAPELADEAHRFALHSTYREAPPGFMGAIARKINGLKDLHPTAGLIVPFVNLPANVAHEFMNWTPIGIWRGRDALPIPGRAGSTAAIEDLYRDVPGFAKQNISDQELRDLSYEYLAKGVIGTLGMAALGGLTVADKDNPDPFLAVNGAGPPDMAHRNQLRAGGWQPYSIKVGPMYIDYQASPFKGALGLVGALSDEMKYGKNTGDWAQALGNAALQDSMAIITDASFLQGLQAVLAAGSGHGRDAKYTVAQFVSQELSSAAMIPFGGTGTKQLWRAFDPQTFGADYKDLGEMVLRNIPVVNSMFLAPRLNPLGEPVDINPLNRIVPTLGTQDQVWRYLDAHNIGLTLPAASTKVDGVQVTPAELYDLTRIRGQALRASLAEAMNDASFRSLPQDEMEAQVKDMEREATDQAKWQIRQQRAQR